MGKNFKLAHRFTYPCLADEKKTGCCWLPAVHSPNSKKSIEDANNIKVSNDKRSEVLQDGGHRNWSNLPILALSILTWDNSMNRGVFEKSEAGLWALFHA